MSRGGGEKHERPDGQSRDPGGLDLARPEVIDVFAKAAEDDDVWMKAASDVKGFLKESGVEVAESAEIILEQVFVRSGSGECPSGLIRLGAPGRICTRSIQLWHKEPHVEPLPRSSSA